ncbi:MAG: hypothetical protein LWX11_05390 [Firmicutes bacterium]|nr:hypothetical protein [Bacillota bacterium]
MPRWPFLAPVGIVLAYAFNTSMQMVNVWRGGTPGWRWMAVLMTLAGLLLGCVMAAGMLASRWKEIRVGDGRIELIPWLAGRSRWALLLWNPPAARMVKAGFIEIPLSQASLEWVGKGLLLHGHPDWEIRLGRGTKAERIAQWLQERGLPKPVGR